MTTLPTSLDHPIDAPLAAGRMRAVAAVGGLAGLALAGASLPEGDLVAGSWVRAGLGASWALAGLLLALRGSQRLAALVAGASVVGAVCAATATSADLATVHVVSASLIPAVALHRSAARTRPAIALRSE